MIIVRIATIGDRLPKGTFDRDSGGLSGTQRRLGCYEVNGLTVGAGSLHGKGGGDRLR